MTTENYFGKSFVFYRDGSNSADAVTFGPALAYHTKKPKVSLRCIRVAALTTAEKTGQSNTNPSTNQNTQTSQTAEK